MVVSNSKRMAVNTLYMYIRMILVLIINLYSSRVLLQVLGVVDFGTYNVVGSVIAMVTMLQSFFSFTTQRYLNYEIGKGNGERLRLLFSMSVLINVFISILFVLVVEILGYWFLNYKINITPDRILAVKWVFQLSVISSVIVITTSTYDALLIANERLSFYAFMSVLKNILTLAIIFLIPYFGYDRLITYAALLFGVQIVIRMISSYYCKTHFKESHFKLCWDNKTFKEMLFFAGYQLIGTSAYALTQNGLNMLFNVYGGVVANAARGIAYQVNAAIYQLSNNVNIAITPFSIKASAKGDNSKMFKMFFFSSKVMFSITLCISIPIMFLTREVLQLWLGTVPNYTVGMVQLVLICSYIRSVHNPVDTLFKAVGKLRDYQITEGILLSCPLLLAWFLFQANQSVYVAFSILIVFEVFNLLSITYLAKKIVGVDLKKYYREVIIPMVVCAGFTLVCYIFNTRYFDHWLYSLLISLLINLICCSYLYLFALDSEERTFILGVIRRSKDL